MQIGEDLVFEWESSLGILHTVTVEGARSSQEEYGADADGRRGVMQDVTEWSGMAIDPPLVIEERAEWDRYEEQKLPDLVASELEEIDAYARADAAAQASEVRADLERIID